MKKLSSSNRVSERGSAGMKLMLVLAIIFLIGHAGINYVPVAYQGASFRQEMDTAVVRGLGASGRIKPMEAVAASIQKASADYDIPNDAYIDIKPINGVVEAHVVYQRQVNMLPFGLYKYKYDFDYTARPVGFLLKQ